MNALNALQDLLVEQVLQVGASQSGDLDEQQIEILGGPRHQAQSQFEAEPVAGASGALDRLPVTAHAGAGIVAGSDPESELIETRVKFRPIVDALA